MELISPTPPQAELISRVFHLTPGDPIPMLTPIEGGITNESFRFQCRGEDCILREPGEDSGEYICRAHEAAVYREIRDLDISDELLAIEPDTGRKISRFWEGARIADPHDPEDVRRCIEMLRRLHSLRITVPFRHVLYRLNAFYRQEMAGIPSAYPDHGEVQRRCLAMEPILNRYLGQGVLCHCDTVAANFLFFPQEGREELRIIDWEYASASDPAMDVGMFANDGYYTREETDALIRLYLGKEPTPDFTLRVYGYLAYTGLTYSDWEETVRAAGEDLGDYGPKQYENARIYSRLFWELLPRVEAEEKHGTH